MELQSRNFRSVSRNKAVFTSWLLMKYIIMFQGKSVWIISDEVGIFTMKPMLTSIIKIKKARAELPFQKSDAGLIIKSLLSGNDDLLNQSCFIRFCHFHEIQTGL